jgi:hypothetical protein
MIRECIADSISRHINAGLLLRLQIRGLNESLNDKQQEADLLRRVQELERKKAEKSTPLRRSKSMRGLINSFSKRRGSLTVPADGDHSKQLSGNAIQR